MSGGCIIFVFQPPDVAGSLRESFIAFSYGESFTLVFFTL